MTHLLLHTCCAPCAIYCSEYWQSQGYEVTALWYNPNIHPFMEHQRRMETLQKWAGAEGLPLIVAEGYDAIDYFRAVAGHEGKRCANCFQLRLGRTASIARDRGFSAFTTTLLISPYQQHQLLRETGDQIAQEHGISFLYEDLRKGFRESHRRAKERNLYRQQYCGCLYSKWERFSRVKIE